MCLLVCWFSFYGCLAGATLYCETTHVLSHLRGKGRYCTTVTFAAHMVYSDGIVSFGSHEPAVSLTYAVYRSKHRCKFQTPGQSLCVAFATVHIHGRLMADAHACEPDLKKETLLLP